MIIQKTSKAHLLTKEVLKKEYIDNKKTQYDIAKKIGCSQALVCKYLKLHKIKTRIVGWRTGTKHKEISKKLIGLAQMNERNHAWKGDDVGYNAVHTWIKKNKKKPNKCEHCKKVTTRLDLSNKYGDYKRDINDYEYLCRKCHMIFDGRINKKQEEETWTKEQKKH